jgi:hypothetical protein
VGLGDTVGDGVGVGEGVAVAVGEGVGVGLGFPFLRRLFADWTSTKWAPPQAASNTVARERERKCFMENNFLGTRRFVINQIK